MKKYHLFEVAGIELEYMLIDVSSLKTVPKVDQLMLSKSGEITSDIDNGKIAWSNELAAHVMEMKTNGPTNDFENLDELFAENIREVNSLLNPLDAKLWPSAAHPLMHPSEMQLWKHHSHKIYELYDRIFDCHSHGWGNVQSMHLNLPFSGDAEFEKLHAAIRVLLPIIPALTASSPIFEGKNTGFKDARMHVYKTNQKEIPELAGKVIPEQVFGKKDYYRKIFDPINSAIKPYDKQGILNQQFLNSRGAIARFDRGAIEIRVIDIQECPKADIAIAVLIVESLKLLVSEDLISLEKQKTCHENDLAAILDLTIKDAENAVITDKDYLELFGFEEEITAAEIWKKLYSMPKENIPEKYRHAIEAIFEQGSLSTRILKAINGDFSEKKIKKTYSELGNCLAKNEVFLPV